MPIPRSQLKRAQQTNPRVSGPALLALLCRPLKAACQRSAARATSAALHSLWRRKTMCDRRAAVQRIPEPDMPSGRTSRRPCWDDADADQQTAVTLARVLAVHGLSASHDQLVGVVDARPAGVGAALPGRRDTQAPRRGDGRDRRRRDRARRRRPVATTVSPAHSSMAGSAGRRASASCPHPLRIRPMPDVRSKICKGLPFGPLRGPNGSLRGRDRRVAEVVRSPGRGLTRSWRGSRQRPRMSRSMSSSAALASRWSLPQARRRPMAIMIGRSRCHAARTLRSGHSHPGCPDEASPGCRPRRPTCAIVGKSGSLEISDAGKTLGKSRADNAETSAVTVTWAIAPT